MCMLGENDKRYENGAFTYNSMGKWHLKKTSTGNFVMMPPKIILHWYATELYGLLRHNQDHIFILNVTGPV